LSDDDALRDRLRAERDERRRIAEVIHDGPVQHVAALVQMLDAVAQALQADDTVGARQIALRALDVTRETAAELREVVRGLEPVDLEELGLAGALRELAERSLGHRGSRIELDLGGDAVAGPDASSGLYQIAREALDQAIRRGPPTNARLALRSTRSGGLELVIEDDAAPERRQAVTDGLAERADQLNGTFAVTRDRGRTRVRVTLPPSAAAL
jgi:signal transduction histidine kinase